MIAIFATVLLFTATHRPPAIPAFDIAAECENAISVPNCQETEHASLGAVRYWWPKVRPERPKLVCIRSASDAPIMRYTRLMRCIAELSHLPHPQLASDRGDR